MLLTNPPVLPHHASFSPLSELCKSSRLRFRHGGSLSLHPFITCKSDTQVNFHAVARITAKDSTHLRPELGEDQASSPHSAAVAVQPAPNPQKSSTLREMGLLPDLVNELWLWNEMPAPPLPGSVFRPDGLLCLKLKFSPL